MKRVLTVKEQKVARDFERAQDEFGKANDKLKEAFSGYKDYLEDDDFIGAKEFLRPMPHSPAKVLMFREILIKEDNNESESN